MVVFLVNLERESKSEPFNYVPFYIWMSSSSLPYTGRMPGEFRHNTIFQSIFKRCLSLLDILITRTVEKPLPINVVCLRMVVSPHFTRHREKPYFSEFSLDSWRHFPPDVPEQLHGLELLIIYLSTSITKRLLIFCVCVFASLTFIVTWKGKLTTAVFVGPNLTFPRLTPPFLFDNTFKTLFLYLFPYCCVPGFEEQVSKKKCPFVLGAEINSR